MLSGLCTNLHKQTPFESEIISAAQNALLSVEILGQFNLRLHPELKQIQEVINEGASIYNARYVTGGNEVSSKGFNRKVRISRRLLRETKEISPTKSILIVSQQKDASKSFLALNQALRDPTTWDQLQTISGLSDINSKKIKAISEEWLLFATHSHFTLDNLFQVADIVEELLSLILMAQAEFDRVKDKAHKENKGAYEEYKKYLENLKETLNKERESIAERLFINCSMALKAGDRQKHHVANDVIEQFQSMGILSQSFTKYLKRDESPLDFAKAFYYITTLGSDALKGAAEKLFALPTLDKLKMKLQAVKQGTDVSLVPTRFVDFIPPKRRRPAWLFRGNHARYTFFKERGELLFKLVSLKFQARKQYNA